MPFFPDRLRCMSLELPDNDPLCGPRNPSDGGIQQHVTVLQSLDKGDCAVTQQNIVIRNHI